jgi:DNA-binding transcriptional ArsR family regulator
MTDESATEAERTSQLTEVNRLERALRHPIRRRILRLLLSSKTVSPPTLAESMPNVSLPLVSYHVRALVTLGIIEIAGRTKRRGRYGHDYRLVADSDLLRGQLWGHRSRVLRVGENDGTAILDPIALQARFRPLRRTSDAIHSHAARPRRERGLLVDALEERDRRIAG